MLLHEGRREWPLLHFIELSPFTRTVEGVLSDRDMRRIEDTLDTDPYSGELISGTGGVRKLRIAMPGRGKRGGARVLYYYVESRFTVYFLLMYAKNQARDLSPDGKRQLSKLVELIDSEED